MSDTRELLERVIRELYYSLNANEDKRQEAVNDPPLAVSVGDEVFVYDEDGSRILACPVVAKHNDHCYAVVSWDDARPFLQAVSEGWFCLTPEEAASEKDARQHIEHGVEYFGKYLARVKKSATYLREPQ